MDWKIGIHGSRNDQEGLKQRGSHMAGQAEDQGWLVDDRVGKDRASKVFEYCLWPQWEFENQRYFDDYTSATWSIRKVPKVLRR